MHKAQMVSFTTLSSSVTIIPMSNAWLKNVLNRPMLQLETDYTKQSYGQVLTRIEAFLEYTDTDRTFKITEKKGYH